MKAAPSFLASLWLHSQFPLQITHPLDELKFPKVLPTALFLSPLMCDPSQISLAPFAVWASGLDCPAGPMNSVTTKQTHHFSPRNVLPPEYSISLLMQLPHLKTLLSLVIPTLSSPLSAIPN